MRKLISILLIAVVFCVFVLSGGNAFSQPSEEMLKQVRLMQTLMEGIALGPDIFQDIDKEQMGITDEQIDSLRTKMMESLQPLAEEMQKKYGRNPNEFAQDKIGEIAEVLSTLVPKANEIYRTVMDDTLSAETIKRIDTASFQKFGGVFGGTLNVENLAALNLSADQKEKSTRIVEQLNRERFELLFSLDMNRGLDLDKTTEIMEKIVSLTRRGQNEIEALLTPEQKKLAEELMADVPEQYRFMSDYLANRPWRLDESSWKPGDSAPPNLENYPGEMRLERPRGGGRAFGD